VLRVAGVANLAALFGIKRRVVEEHFVAHDTEDHRRVDGIHLTPDELRRPELGDQPLIFLCGGTHRETPALAGGPRPVPLGGHLCIETGLVHGKPAELGRLSGDLQGEPEGVVESEGDRAGQGVTGIEFVECRIQQLTAVGERAAERCFFALGHAEE
jgi:hypothetical protein